MDAGARRVGLFGIAASFVWVLAGCYPASFHGPGGDAAADAVSDVTGSDGPILDGTGSDVSDGTSVPDVAQDVLQPFGNCVAPVLCGGNVCPAGRCTMATPAGCDPLGDGIDPDISAYSRGTLVTTTTGLNLMPNVDAPLEVTDSSVFTAGHEALLYVVTGPGSGTFAPVVVHCISSPTQIFVVSPVVFRVSATAQMQLVPVLHLTHIGHGGTKFQMVSASIDPLHPSLGGIVALRVQGAVSATITASGYLGGTPPTTMGVGGDGRSSGSVSLQATAGHGGVLCSAGACSSGNGGGGANVTAGQPATGSGCGTPPAGGGAASMVTTRFVAAFGTGGGSGAFSTGTVPGAGGAGGGAVFLAAQSFFGSIDVSGGRGIANNASSSGGGGGGGGTIVFVIPDLSMGAPVFNAQGGSGSTGNCEGTGGSGGDGVIRVYCTTSATGPCGGALNPVPNAMPGMTYTHDLPTSPF